MPLTISEFEAHLAKAVFSKVTWVTKRTEIVAADGSTVFALDNVEVPETWSQTAANVVASKYFRKGESSVKQLISRVACTIAWWGQEDGYFRTGEVAEHFLERLGFLLVRQEAAFNSPVWFNLGIDEKPQVSACFIQSVDDTMEGILDLAKNEGMLFKYGSGTGTNLSSLRSSKEELSGGGHASGPVSFMKGYDSFAGAIKSGGKTRRSAKMVVLNVSHPDIMDFIRCKADEEKKAHALIEAGYDGGFNVPGGAYDSVQFQNANHSVSVTDDFMKAVRDDLHWSTRKIKDSTQIVDIYKARYIFRAIAQAAWECGDPGLQFWSTLNKWHTCKHVGPIRASNPCGEYVFLDNSACNLASINLLKFLRGASFDIDGFERAVRTLITAMDIIVSRASYPTKAIEENSHRYRTLGLGYANLGAMLMQLGLPYDSPAGRGLAATITSLMTAVAYKQSGLLAKDLGAFDGCDKSAMLDVLTKHHQETLRASTPPKLAYELRQQAEVVWESTLRLASTHGMRNAQVTLLAPTGTISFMMDCQTTGIEPELALVKYKSLSGGGVIKLVNSSVGEALKTLGYSETEIQTIVFYLEARGNIETCPTLKPEHYAVFDCAFQHQGGQRFIAPLGHLKMMAAVQPFLSGAISKTVNMPESSTVEDIEAIYMEAWNLGLKAVAVYRDGCKKTQPLSTKDPSTKTEEPAKPSELGAAPAAVRAKLPDERPSITHKFSIAGHEGYVTVGLYENGQPGEVFVRMSKEGSTLSGIMDSFATAVSLALQHGVPLATLASKFSHSRYEPSGFTNNKRIPIAKSLTDYIFRWMADKFMTPEEAAELGVHVENEVPAKASQTARSAQVTQTTASQKTDAPPCGTCGEIMVRNAACYKCLNCGSTSGCS